MGVDSEIHSIKESVGRGLALQQLDRLDKIKTLADAEFKVFSQFGDDGIIQYLVQKLNFSEKEKTFVEFGTERYTESNTRFLLVNNNWSGLAMDATQEFVDFIKNDEISWRNDLQVFCTMVNPDNINELVAKSGLTPNLGILSVDIDGMDYWVWKAFNIDKPVLVICEYNSVYGPDMKVTVPYEPEFWRTKAHSSNLYWGCSLNALVELADQKGYSFIGSNSAGNNCYFVRNDRMQGLKKLDAKTGYVESKFRESRDKTGALTFIRGPERMRVIQDMPIWDLKSGSLKPIRELL